MDWGLLLFHPISYFINNTPSYFSQILQVNSLPNDKILDVTKLKAIADDKSNVTKMMISLFDRVENTVGKGENAG